MAQATVIQAAVTRNAKVMHGTPCFAGTRVPVKSLFDHLEAGYNVEYFVLQFPSVTREQVFQVLRSGCEMLEDAAVVIEARE